MVRGSSDSVSVEPSRGSPRVPGMHRSVPKVVSARVPGRNGSEEGSAERGAVGDIT